MVENDGRKRDIVMRKGMDRMYPEDQVISACTGKFANEINKK